MTDSVRQFIDAYTDAFRVRLERELKKRFPCEDKSLTVTLQVSYSFIINPRVRVLSEPCNAARKDFNGVDTSKVPTYNWKMYEKVVITREQVPLSAIAAAVERLSNEYLLIDMLKVFAGNGNAPLTRDELKELGAPCSFKQMARILLRSSGVPFTLDWDNGEVRSEDERGYKLFTVHPPKLFKPNEE